MSSTDLSSKESERILSETSHKEQHKYCLMQIQLDTGQQTEKHLWKTENQTLGGAVSRLSERYSQRPTSFISAVWSVAVLSTENISSPHSAPSWKRCLSLKGSCSLWEITAVNSTAVLWTDWLGMMHFKRYFLKVAHISVAMCMNFTDRHNNNVNLQILVRYTDGKYVPFTISQRHWSLYHRSSPLYSPDSKAVPLKPMIVTFSTEVFYYCWVRSGDNCAFLQSLKIEYAVKKQHAKLHMLHSVLLCLPKKNWFHFF